MDHQPSDEELDALLSTIATLIGFEKEGWIEKLVVSKTYAEFKLVKLPPEEMMNNFIRMICAKYKLNLNLYVAARQGNYTIQRRGDHHILHIGT